MIAIPILQTICFSLYVWYIVYHFNVIQSISESWYREGPTRKKFMFILFIISISVPTLILGILTKNVWFMACAGSLGIIGFAPAFRSEHKIVGVLHTGGTVAGIAFAAYALLTHGIYFPLVEGAAISFILSRVKVSNLTFWQEINWFFHLSTLGIFQMITLGI